jgi:AraC-like DNA-binding protein
MDRLFVRLDGDRPFGPEAEVPAGSTRECAVPAALRGCVSQILWYEEDFGDGPGVVEHVVPDGALRLVVHLADTPLVAGQLAQPLVVVGPSAAPAAVRLHGRMRGLSLTLEAGAAARLFDLAAGELQQLALPIDALWGDAGHALGEQLMDARTSVDVLHRLRQALGARLAAAPSATERAIARDLERLRALPARAATSRTVDPRPALRSVRALARELNIGERRLQQLFHAHLGLPPRTWLRLARVHRLLRRLRDAPAPWSRLAAETGFSDQSHLSNEFRALVGMAPGAWLRRTVSRSSKTGAGVARGPVNAYLAHAPGLGGARS